MRVLRLAVLVGALVTIPAARATAEPPPHVTAQRVHAEDVVLVSNSPAITAVDANLNLLGTAGAALRYHAVRVATRDLRSTDAALALVQSAASSTDITSAPVIANAPVDNDSGHGWFFWTIWVVIALAIIYAIYHLSTRSDENSSGRSRSG